MCLYISNLGQKRLLPTSDDFSLKVAVESMSPMSYIGPIPISTVIKQIRITSKNVTIKACLEGGGPGDAHKEGFYTAKQGNRPTFST